VFISISDTLQSSKFQQRIKKYIIPFVAEVTPEADFCIQKGYAMVLAISIEVRQFYCASVMCVIFVCSRAKG